MLTFQAFIQSPGETFLNLGFLTIRWYGLLISVSVLIGLFVSKKLAKARNINPEYISEILPSLIISSIIGARTYYVIFEWRRHIGENFFTSSVSGTIDSIETIEDGSYKINIENENGEITTEAVPVGPQLIVKAQDKINAGDPLTNDPNVGGFGQLDAEVVLQSPYRVIGLIAFFIGVGLTQILLVLKKKQVEKVQAAEGI